MKKALSMILCIVLVAAIAVMGTLAYLTDRSTVTNTFTVGNVDIEVDEEKVNPDGTPTEEEDDRVTGNEYHLIPGQTYTKDPTMTVAKGSEESYVRMLVTVHGAAQLQQAFGEDFDPADYIEGWEPEVWLYHGPKVVDLTANTVTYEFRYHDTVDAFDAEEDVVLEPLFTAFTLPGEVTGEQLAMLQDALKIVVDGHAIQAVGFEDADAAWAAFDVQNAE